MYQILQRDFRPSEPLSVTAVMKTSIQLLRYTTILLLSFQPLAFAGVEISPLVPAKSTQQRPADPDSFDLRQIDELVTDNLFRQFVGNAKGMNPDVRQGWLKVFAEPLTWGAESLRPIYGQILQLIQNTDVAQIQDDIEKSKKVLLAKYETDRLSAKARWEKERPARLKEIAALQTQVHSLENQIKSLQPKLQQTPKLPMAEPRWQPSTIWQKTLLTRLTIKAEALRRAGKDERSIQELISAEFDKNVRIPGSYDLYDDIRAERGEDKSNADNTKHTSDYQISGLVPTYRIRMIEHALGHGLQDLDVSPSSKSNQTLEELQTSLEEKKQALASRKESLDKFYFAMEPNYVPVQPAAALELLGHLKKLQRGKNAFGLSFCDSAVDEIKKTKSIQPKWFSEIVLSHLSDGKISKLILGDHTRSPKPTSIDPDISVGTVDRLLSKFNALEKLMDQEGFDGKSEFIRTSMGGLARETLDLGGSDFEAVMRIIALKRIASEGEPVYGAYQSFIDSMEQLWFKDLSWYKAWASKLKNFATRPSCQEEAIALPEPKENDWGPLAPDYSFSGPFSTKRALESPRKNIEAFEKHVRATAGKFAPYFLDQCTDAFLKLETKAP